MERRRVLAPGACERITRRLAKRERLTGIIARYFFVGLICRVLLAARRPHTTITSHDSPESIPSAGRLNRAAGVYWSAPVVAKCGLVP